MATQIIENLLISFTAMNRFGKGKYLGQYVTLQAGDGKPGPAYLSMLVHAKLESKPHSNHVKHQRCLWVSERMLQAGIRLQRVYEGIGVNEEDYYV
ncbi:hypothetical protein M5K25_014207 [Dendrobium thyrsiflorum]|uniref:Uncharacterized protein n=1 Tax=Dendrobium thyrsiflorum TaxID=117978 RepID=A0ABD0V2T7_DENTH